MYINLKIVDFCNVIDGEKLRIKIFDYLIE